MSRITYDTKQAEAIITEAEANSVFVSLKSASDGTVGDVDATNLRDGALSSKHIAQQQVHQQLGTVDAGSVSSGTTRSSGSAGAATAWVTLADALLNSPLLAVEGDVLRWHFNPLVGDGAASGGSTTKAQQVYYWRVQLLYNTGGGTLVLEIQEPVGYGLCYRSGNDASTGGSEGDLVAPWCRNAIAGIWINRGNTTWNIMGVRLQFRWAVNDHASVANTIDTCHLNGACIMERM
tara:strand:- start:6550 stop:7254 length:705 start_codon:yes stop_codon:yes gene_type:complete